MPITAPLAVVATAELVRQQWSDAADRATRRDGDAIVAKWGTPETEVGETTYRLMPDGTMAITDRVQSKDGQWRQFGQMVARRINQDR